MAGSGVSAAGEPRKPPETGNKLPPERKELEYPRANGGGDGPDIQPSPPSTQEKISNGQRSPFGETEERHGVGRGSAVKVEEKGAEVGVVVEDRRGAAEVARKPRP